jgi:hypothetical protein
MLTLLILRKEYVKNENIDVYLQPLVEKLQELWKWVKTLDVTKLTNKFLLIAICMWSLHNYPAYYLFDSYQTKGYLACPLCGPKVDTRRYLHLKKYIYLGHRRYLVKGHPYRRDNVAFNGKMEIRSALPRVSTIDFLKRPKEWEAWLARRRLHASEDRDQDPIHTHGVKRKNIFFFLPYL